MITIRKVQLFGPLILVLSFCVISCDLIFAQNQETEKKELPKKQADLYLRATDVVPGTLKEMRDVTYWISKMSSPDELVLAPNEIENRNRDYANYLTQEAGSDSVLTGQINKQLRDRPGLLTEIPDLYSMTTAQLSVWTESKIKSELDYLRSRDFGNIMSIAYSAKELDEIESEILFDPVKAVETPRSGITVLQCQLKIIPTIKPEHIGLFTNGKARWDLWNLDVLPIGTPVQVLQASESAAFLFVLTQRGYGWVSAEKIAFGSSTDVETFVAETDFIICTGDRVPFYSDSNCTSFLGWLQMGDRLPLGLNSLRSVQIPSRTTSGAFTITEAWITPDADVSLGYLPYTRRNAVAQSFKLLDNLYDWTGAWYGRNHVTNLRDIYSSFGFNLPANGILLSAYGQRSRMVFMKGGREAQLNSIFSSEPFLTLLICENSHSQMYMGNLEGMPIVFDAHGYGYKDEQGNEVELKRWVVGTMEMPDYFLKQNITFVDLY